MKMMSLTYWGLATLLLSGACALAFVGPASAAEPKVGEEWEMRTTLEMPGMPFSIPPTVVHQCIESKDTVPYQEKKGEKCVTIYKNMSGNALNWQVVCNGKDGKMEMTGVSVYNGDTMDSKIKVKGKRGDMSMHMTGKKLGPCK